MPSSGMCENRGPSCMCVYVCPHSHTLKGTAHKPPTSTHPDTNHDWHTDAYRKRQGAESGTEWHSSRHFGIGPECLTVPTHEDTQRQMVLKARPPQRSLSVDLLEFLLKKTDKRKKDRGRLGPWPSTSHSCIYSG